MNALAPLFSHLGHPRVLVIGDAMLDRYTWGDAERVSPEAPVLVLRADECEVRLGGAASVAMLLRGLETSVTLAGVIGDDASGRTVRRLLDESKIDAALLVTDPARPTTTKERFLGRAANRHAHQILRVDTESRTPLADEFAAQMAREAATLIPRLAVTPLAASPYAAVLISDYGKGVCTPELVASVLAASRAAGVPVLVDPARGTDFSIYRGATLLKPNRLEAESALGHAIASPTDALRAATALRERHGFEAVVITLDREGLVLATTAGAEHFPIAPRAVYDITGAGDMVLAMLGLCLAAGLPLPVATQLANVAAGLEVQQPGVTPISHADVLSELERLSVSAQTPGTPFRINPFAAGWKHSPSAESRHLNHEEKLVTLDKAERLADEHRRAGRTVVFTNGCFDLLHLGHVRCLEEARQSGDVLFVAINSDASVRRLKGADRPLIAELDRAQMLTALVCFKQLMKVVRVLGALFRAGRRRPARNNAPNGRPEIVQPLALITP